MFFCHVVVKCVQPSTQHCSKIKTLPKPAKQLSVVLYVPLYQLHWAEVPLVLLLLVPERTYCMSPYQLLTCCCRRGWQMKFSVVLHTQSVPHPDSLWHQSVRPNMHRVRRTDSCMFLFTLVCELILTLKNQRIINRDHLRLICLLDFKCVLNVLRPIRT